MSAIIAYVTVTEDAFWQGQAAELKDNLAAFGLELYIDTVSKTKIESNDLESKYHMCDHAFVKFAQQESRRILLLNAEIRMHKPLPQAWIDSDSSVIFYNKPRLGVDINNGQGIWNKNGVAAYQRAMDIVSSNDWPQEDVEDNTVQWLEPHIKASMSLDRFAEPDADATRGYWVGSKTIFTHPYIDGLSLRSKKHKQLDPVTKMPLLRHRDFINHFSPNDDAVLRSVYQQLVSLQKSIKGVALDATVVELEMDLPGNLTIKPKSTHLVYQVAGWKLCPSLGLVAPKEDWASQAWRLAELDDGR